MRALVVGGAGFIGASLVERLLAERWAVDVIDDLSSGSLERLADVRADRSNALRIHRHDITDPETAELVARIAPDRVFVLAAPAPGSDPVRPLEVGVAGLVRVLDGAATSGASKVVAALRGGDLHRGADRAPVHEDQRSEPLDVSMVAARAALEALATYRATRQLEFTALVLGDVYGPGMPSPGPLAALCAAALTGEPLALAPDRPLDPVHLDDTVDAICRAGERADGLVVHVAAGEPCTAREVATVLAGLGTPVTFDPLPEADDRPVPALDVGRAAIHLGWTPFTGLEDGLRSVLAAA